MDNGIYKKGLAVVLTITIILLTAIGVKISSKEEEITNIIDKDSLVNEEKISNDVPVIEKSNKITVDIDGAVKNPGVYELVDGDRVEDALKKAGGLLETAYTKNINRARILSDSEKIYIAEIDEINSGVEITDNSIYNTDESVYNDKININTASKELLMSLDGIGEVYSQRIIDYRSKAKFSTIEEIKKVKGIGDKTFEGLKDKITVN